MSEFENDLQRLTFLKRTIALLSSMVDCGECHTTRSKEMKNNAQQVILEMEANVVQTSDSGLHLQRVSQQRELLLAYHKWYLEHRGTVPDSSPEAMVKMYKANNCG